MYRVFQLILLCACIVMQRVKIKGAYFELHSDTSAEIKLCLVCSLRSIADDGSIFKTTKHIANVNLNLCERGDISRNAFAAEMHFAIAASVDSGINRRATPTFSQSFEILEPSIRGKFHNFPP